MKQTVTSHQFVDSFSLCNRQGQFSVAARYALFDYLESFEQDCGVELELDPIGICCDWAEHKSAILSSKEYGQTFDNESEALDWLREHTQVIEFDGGIVVQLF